MPDLQWNPSDSVGIASLDAQHQGLFATAHRLREALRTWRAINIQHEILAELVAYYMAHCEREERVMQTADFPALAVHQEQHRALLEQIQAVHPELQGGRPVASLQRVERVCAWMREHVSSADAQYALWIRRREFRPVVYEVSKKSPTQEKIQCHS